MYMESKCLNLSIRNRMRWMLFDEKQIERSKFMITFEKFPTNSNSATAGTVSFVKKHPEALVLSVLKLASALSMHNALYVNLFEITISYNIGMISLPLLSLLYQSWIPTIIIMSGNFVPFYGDLYGVWFVYYYFIIIIVIAVVIAVIIIQSLSLLVVLLVILLLLFLLL